MISLCLVNHIFFSLPVVIYVSIVFKIRVSVFSLNFYQEPVQQYKDADRNHEKTTEIHDSRIL